MPCGAETSTVLATSSVSVSMPWQRARRQIRVRRRLSPLAQIRVKAEWVVALSVGDTASAVTGVAKHLALLPQRTPQQAQRLELQGPRFLVDP